MHVFEIFRFKRIFGEKFKFLGTEYALSSPYSPEKNGWKATNKWQNESTGDVYSDPMTLPSGINATYVPNYELGVFKIEYVLNGGKDISGKNPSSYTYTKGVASFASPVRKGYDFAGWYEDKEMKKKIVSISKNDFGDKVLYAKWTPVKKNDGHGGNASNDGEITSDNNDNINKTSSLTTTNQNSGEAGVSQNSFPATGDMVGWLVVLLVLAMTGSCCVLIAISKIDD